MNPFAAQLALLEVLENRALEALLNGARIDVLPASAASVADLGAALEALENRRIAAILNAHMNLTALACCHHVGLELTSGPVEHVADGIAELSARASEVRSHGGRMKALARVCETKLAATA